MNLGRGQAGERHLKGDTDCSKAAGSGMTEYRELGTLVALDVREFLVQEQGELLHVAVGMLDGVQGAEGDGDALQLPWGVGDLAVQTLESPLGQTDALDALLAEHVATVQVPRTQQFQGVEAIAQLALHIIDYMSGEKRAQVSSQQGLVDQTGHSLGRVEDTHRRLSPLLPDADTLHVCQAENLGVGGGAGRGGRHGGQKEEREQGGVDAGGEPEGELHADEGEDETKADEVGEMGVEEGEVVRQVRSDPPLVLEAEETVEEGEVQEP